MTLDELIEQLTALRSAAAGASIARVRITVYTSMILEYRPFERIDQPLARVFYHGGEIVLSV